MRNKRASMLGFRRTAGLCMIVLLCISPSTTSGLEIVLPKWRETFMNKAPTPKIRSPIPKKREVQPREPPPLECRDLHLLDDLLNQRKVQIDLPPDTRLRQRAPAPCVQAEMLSQKIQLHHDMHRGTHSTGIRKQMSALCLLSGVFLFSTPLQKSLC
jgi:hypothetical protein